MRVQLDRITVGSDLYGGESLFVHPSASHAEAAVDDSPISDGVMMSTTTYHRPARKADVRRLQYDRHTGQLIELA